MAITITISNHIMHQTMQGNINFSTDTFKLVMMTGEFTFDEDAHDYYYQVSGEECQNGGYTVGGITLTGGSLTRDDDNNRIERSFDNPSLTASGEFGPCRGGLMVDDTASNDPVVGFADFGEAITVNNGSVLQFQTIVVRLSS